MKLGSRLTPENQAMVLSILVNKNEINMRNRKLLL